MPKIKQRPTAGTELRLAWGVVSDIPVSAIGAGVNPAVPFAIRENKPREGGLRRGGNRRPVVVDYGHRQRGAGFEVVHGRTNRICAKPRARRIRRRRKMKARRGLARFRTALPRDCSNHGLFCSPARLIRKWRKP